MANYLLDSDVLIWILRGRKDSIDLIDELSDGGAPACSVISRYEVEVGMRKKELQSTQKLLNGLAELPVSSAIASLGAKIVREYKIKGQIISPFDAIIAATCIVNDLALVTYNPKHFPMPELRKYPI